jgi:hypothetical protein
VASALAQTREHGFKREAVVMNIGYRSKFHRPTPLIG